MKRTVRRGIRCPKLRGGGGGGESRHRRQRPLGPWTRGSERRERGQRERGGRSGREKNCVLCRLSGSGGRPECKKGNILHSRIPNPSPSSREARETRTRRLPYIDCSTHTHRCRTAVQSSPVTHPSASQPATAAIPVSHFSLFLIN